MTREELIAYDKWLTRRKWGTGEIISPERAADIYLAEHPLPPAEGAEEITAKEYLQNKYPQMRGHLWNSNEHINDDWIAEMMEGFATLHAQRIAEKMVEERLRKELIAYDKWLYYKWIEGDVTTTEEHINEYLKSREK